MAVANESTFRERERQMLVGWVVKPLSAAIPAHGKFSRRSGNGTLVGLGGPDRR